MFIVSIFIIVPKQKHHKCSSIVGQIKRQWYILTTVEKNQLLYTQQHGSFLKTLCWVQEARHKRIDIIRFYLYEVQEQDKVIYGSNCDKLKIMITSRGRG